MRHVPQSQIAPSPCAPSHRRCQLRTSSSCRRVVCRDGVMAGSKRLEAQTRGGTGALSRPTSTLDTRGLPQAPALEGLTVCMSTSPAQARRTTRRRSPEQVSGGSGRQAPGVGAGGGCGARSSSSSSGEQEITGRQEPSRRGACGADPDPVERSCQKYRDTAGERQ